MLWLRTQKMKAKQPYNMTINSSWEGETFSCNHEYLDTGFLWVLAMSPSLSLSLFSQIRISQNDKVRHNLWLGWSWNGGVRLILLHQKTVLLDKKRSFGARGTLPKLLSINSGKHCGEFHFALVNVMIITIRYHVSLFRTSKSQIALV